MGVVKWELGKDVAVGFEMWGSILFTSQGITDIDFTCFTVCNHSDMTEDKISLGVCCYTLNK